MGIWTYGTPSKGWKRKLHFLIRRLIKREQFWYIEEEG